MTLQDLLDDLTSLHPSSRSATVEVEGTGEVLSVRYEMGVCTIQCEEIPDRLKDDDEDDV